MADKLSFAMGLDKWQWMLGAGVCLDDVFAQTAAAKTHLREEIGQAFLVVAFIVVPAIMVVFAACTLVTLRERRMADGKLKALAQRIIDTQEEERTRLACELHGGIAQNPVGIRYAVDLAGRKVRNHTDDASGAIEKGVEALNGAIKEVRLLSHDLRPSALGDLGPDGVQQPFFRTDRARRRCQKG